MTEINLVPVENEMKVLETMAKNAVQSRFYKQFGDTTAVMSIMLSARELGISPMSALNGGLNIIQGKVEISARMMNALIRRAGGSIQTKVCNEKECVLIGKRADNKDTEQASFSMDEAKAAGLVKPGGGWQKYPSDMLYARALSRLARRLFPDIIGCCYVEGEIMPSKEEPVREDETIDLKVERINPSEEAAKQIKEVKELKPMIRYISLIHEKFGIDYDEIVKKYLEDPKEFMKKFNQWKEKDEKNSTN